VTVDQILNILRKEADPLKIEMKQSKFGVISNNALGIFHKDLKQLAKEIPKDDDLAIELFDSGIYEGRILCSKIYNPDKLSQELMNHWISTFENWEICDSFCMGQFAKSRHAVPMVIEWTSRTKEFEKRAGFATIAAYCMADKESGNETFEQFFPIIQRECKDERIYVKKAVNWALRNIGKRNIDLRSKAISVANNILQVDNKTAKWIASNALKELTRNKLRISDYPRKLYRKTSK